MNTGDLDGALLASVSRSFYLTIKALPPKLGAPIGLGYLLARATDTIADSANAPAAMRLKHLNALRDMIERGPDDETLARLKAEIVPADAAERTLIEKLDRCFQWLVSMNEADRAEINTVLNKIIRGQELDLLRFGNQPRALDTSAELDEYTYLVAGCVGEFWTRLCFRHVPHFANLDAEKMRRLGMNFGKGLQLVNILRDLPADLKAGRCYLPLAEERLTFAMIQQSPQACAPLFDRWLARAARHLDDACEYIAAISNFRLRYACILPWRIGMRTLALLQRTLPLATDRRIKVSRYEIRALLLAALLPARSNFFLRRWRKQLGSRLANQDAAINLS